MLQRSIFIVALISLIFAVGAASAQALDAPVPISPAVQYGTTAKYYAPRVPTYMWSPVANATWYYLWIGEFDTGTLWKTQWVRGLNQWRPSSEDRLVAGTEYKWWVRAWNSAEGYGPWSSQATFTAGELKYMSINVNDFINQFDDGLGEYYRGGALLVPSNDGSTNWCAPLNLPHGARVHSIWFYYYNNGAVITPSECYLRRSRYNLTTDEEMVTVTAGAASGAGYAIPTEAISNDIIDNFNYTYFVLVWLGSTNHRLMSVGLRYWD